MNNLSNIGVFKLKLRSQGLFLVVALLIMELTYLGAFWRLLQVTENESRKEERSKQNLASLQKLLRLVYDGGVAFEFYTTSPDLERKTRLLSDVAQTRSQLQWMREHSNGRSETEQHADFDLSQIQSGVEQTAVMVNEVVHICEAKVDSGAQIENIKKKLHSVQLNVVAQASDLLKTETQVALDSPVAQRKARENIKSLLLAALPLNLILAILMALFFTRSITSRLDILVDNTARLKKRLPLNPLLAGDDEIAVLDSTFHEMATALVKDEELLKANEARIRKMIDSMPVGLLIINRNNTIQFNNPRIAQMLGYQEVDLIGMAFENLFASTAIDGSLPAEALSLCIARATSEVVELIAVRKDGRALPVELSITNFGSETDERKLATLIDVTSRHELQKMRQAFVAMVSHELRAPLTSIRGFFSLMDLGAYGQLSPEALEGANRAENNTIRLIALINDLLDLEKMEGGNFNIEAKECSLNSVIQSSVDNVKLMAEAKGVALVVPAVSLTVYADADRLVQVLVNLLSNAIKFSEADEQVQIAVSSHGASVDIRIIDHGRGIPDNFKASIFERFQQVEEADAKKRGGSGLGLPISKAIVEKHGGTISVESEWGAGSTFLVRIPLLERI